MVFYRLPGSIRKVVPVFIIIFLSTMTYARSLPGSIQRNVVPDSVVSGLQHQKDFAYANDPAYWKKDHPANPKGPDLFDLFITQKWVRFLVCFILIALLLYAAYHLLIGNRWGMFYPGAKKRKKEQGSLEEEIKVDLETTIAAAVRDKEYRLAIRFMYLKALRLLEDKGWICLNRESTNRDYLNALAAYPLARPFRIITRSYDYVWYGEFALNEQQFEHLRKDFELFYDNVSSSVHNKPGN